MGATRECRRTLGSLSTAVLVTLVLAPSAFAVAPSNDNLANARSVDLNGPEVSVVTTDATVEANEPLTPLGPGACAGQEMIATTWYQVVGNGGTISIDTAGSDFDTVLAVYAAPTPTIDDGLPCNDDASDAVVTSEVTFQSQAGAVYLVQVGGCRECGTPTEGRLRLHVRATVPPGGSGGGTGGGGTGGGGGQMTEQRPVLFIQARLGTSRSGTGVRVHYLRILAPVGARIRVSCTLRACRSYVRRVPALGRAKQRVVTVPTLRNRRLRNGTQVRIYVTQRGTIGQYQTFTVRRGRAQPSFRRCLAPGSSRPGPCP